MSTQKGPALAYGRAAEIFAWGDHQVLKLFRGHWMATAEREAQVARVAFANGIKTPRAYEIVEIEGRTGIVYERVNGPSMLTVLTTQPWRFLQLVRAFAELHATLHQVAAPELRAAREVLQTDIQK